MRSVVILAFLVYGNAFAESEGERLTYVVGCINCHHQTPKDIINAPPLSIVGSYSIDEFRQLLKTGKTKTDRDLLAIGSIMGIVSAEQFSHLSIEEVQLIYEFLRREWSPDRAALEEAKIQTLYKQELEQ